MSDIERTEFNLPESVDAAHATQRNSDVDATAHSEEHDIERSLRPKSLEEFIGQPKVREQLSLVLKAAKNRGVTPATFCFRGRPVWARPRWR